MINQAHAEILEKRGLDIELITNLGIRSSTRYITELDAKVDGIEIPYFDGESEVDFKFRTLGADKYFSRKKGAPLVLYNLNCISDESLKDYPLIITEGELDCWAAIQCGYARCISVPNGTPEKAAGSEDGERFRYLEGVKGLAGVKEIILAVDNDTAGTALLQDLGLRLGRVRCRWVQYPRGCKDLADALLKYGPRGVKASIERAKWFEIGGLYRMSELPPLPSVRAVDSGFPGLRDHWRIREGDLTVITGIPSSGKTTVANVICCLMASHHNWPTVFASFEQVPQRDHRRFLRTWHNGKLVIHQTDDEIARADSWIDNNFYFISPGDDDEPTLGWLLERLSSAVVRHGVKICVIDPWNEVQHEIPRGMSTTDYIGDALNTLKRFARKHLIHMMVVAHPMKLRRNADGTFPVPSLYDISDSAHWFNKPDVGVVVFRKGDVRIVRVQKSRYHDEIGTPGDVPVKYVHDRATFEPADDEQEPSSKRSKW